MKQQPDLLQKDPVTLEEYLQLARDIMIYAGNEAAKQLGQSPPHLVETKLLNGAIRIVAEWPDGEHSNECIVQPLSQLGGIEG